MRFVRGCPFRNRPECIHHSARTVGKLIGEPPLVEEGCVGSAREALKITDEIERSVSLLLVGCIACLGIVERFNGSQSGAMAIATLGRRIAAIVLAVSLFGRDECSVNDVLGPLGCGFYPIDEFPR